ncbi:MAG: NAD(+) synthase, partial [Anaerolineales bacterium]
IQRAFIGLSGGIDSALVACLAAEALGPERVTGVALPSRYTEERSTESAEELAKNLGIGFEVVPIQEMHRSAEASLGKLLEEGTGAENLQARLRMIVLMGYVNRYGGMLLNTGNKTEAALGYATLYGDTAGSLCPIGDLTKPQVYRLAEWVNRERELIPPFCLSRAPSAELRPGQVDPFDYEEISPKLEALVQANRSSPAMRLAEHKRAQSGVVLKVSEKAFGPGRMIPITRK